MVTPAWATAEGVFERDGDRQPAVAELSHEGLAIIAADGRLIALWKPGDIMRTEGPDGLRIGIRHKAGAFLFAPGKGDDLVRMLSSESDVHAPMTPRELVRTMAMIIAVVLVALVVLAIGGFWLAEWLLAVGPGSNGAG